MTDTPSDDVPTVQLRVPADSLAYTRQGMCTREPITLTVGKHNRVVIVRHLPGKLLARPSRTLNDWTHPATLRAIATLHIGPDSDPEIVNFPLVIDHVDQPDDERSNVE